LNRSLLFASVFAATLAGAAPALAQVNGTASYVVSLGGINVAALDVSLKDDGKRYALNLEAKVSGLGQLVASGTARVDASGRSTSPALTSEAFRLHTRANGQDFGVRIDYAGKDVTAFVVEPPLLDNYDRVPIERKHLRNVGDMLSAFVFKGGKLDASLCQRKIKVFTGVEQFDLALAFAREDVATSVRTGYQGPVVLCNVDYTPVSGHFTSSEVTTYLAESDRILIWYAPMGETGYFIPYRVLLSTGAGDLSMVLTSLSY